MKKFFVGLFVGLIALFGSIASVGSKASFNNFNDFKTVKNAVVQTTTNVYTIYLDNTVNNYTNVEYLDLFYTDNSFLVQTYYNDTLLDNFSNEFASISFSCESDNDSGENYFSINNDKYLIKVNYIPEGAPTDFEINTWYSALSLSKINKVVLVDFTVDGTLEEANNLLSPYIGNLTSLPSEEPIPPPDIGSMESSIGNVVRGIIDWFVDIFNGLADVFVIYDSTGQFIGFSVWGQVLFIEVGIGLVMIVLKWVISLIRGI